MVMKHGLLYVVGARASPDDCSAGVAELAGIDVNGLVPAKK
jgi:hypothetical protein